MLRTRFLSAQSHSINLIKRHFILASFPISSPPSNNEFHIYVPYHSEIYEHERGKKASTFLSDTIITIESLALFVKMNTFPFFVRFLFIEFIPDRCVISIQVKMLHRYTNLLLKCCCTKCIKRFECYFIELCKRKTYLIDSNLSQACEIKWCMKTEKNCLLLLLEP